MASASSPSTLNPVLANQHKHKAKLATSNLIVPQNLTASSTKPDPIRPNSSSVRREIQGSGNWEHLVNPLNPLLRSEIIRYGEFVSACYKSFDFDPKSKRYLNCKYGKKSMLSSTGMASSGYEVTKYIYATPDIAVPTQPGACSARWIGYVAVSTDEEENFGIGRKDIVVAFRGTVTYTEWIANMMSSLTAARFDPNDPKPDVCWEITRIPLLPDLRESENKCAKLGDTQDLRGSAQNCLRPRAAADLSLFGRNFTNTLTDAHSQFHSENFSQFSH